MLKKIALLGLWLLAAVAQAGDLGLVEKKTFNYGNYTTTVGGAEIQGVQVGYETYGSLNATGDNAIFVPHYYSGNSHAAGRYSAADAAPGYWDAIIGPGKAIDTDKYFVISADALVNLGVNDPKVVTTGPATINPATGKRWGMSFPVVSYHDTVSIHKALVDSLGVKKLHAVAGASGGSVQSMIWAAMYPEFVDRVVHVIGPGFDAPPFLIALLDVWTTPIRMDPKWNGGDYYEGEAPNEGVAQALKIVTLTSTHWDWAARVFGFAPADPAKPPAEAFGNQFRIEAALNALGRSRATQVDANHMLYMSKANALYRLSDEEVKGICAKFLFVPASSDMIFPPFFSERAMAKVKANGGRAEMFVMESDAGHLAGLFEIAKAAEAIRAFLASD